MHGREPDRVGIERMGYSLGVDVYVDGARADGTNVGRSYAETISPTLKPFNSSHPEPPEPYIPVIVL